MQLNETEKIHYFTSVEGITLPALFTYPFHYTPHPLTEKAALEVQQYLRTRTDWADELNAGKMFGVLIVRTSQGRIGYLAAFPAIWLGAITMLFLSLRCTICSVPTAFSNKRKLSYRGSITGLKNWKKATVITC